jgi:methyltransferase (TIGR00027 family)
MIIRTAVFDEILLNAVRNRQIDLVVNLAAGLDARPWRLPLPASLHWVDVDLPGILDYKSEMLRGETPVCRYEARKVDLRDAEARRALFAELGGGAARAIVVTEGLLVYLQPEQVAALATDLHAQPGFRLWVSDLASPQLLKKLSRGWGKTLAERGSPLIFGPAEGTEFFRSYGWREVEFRSTFHEAIRLRRAPKGSWIWKLIARLSTKKGREKLRRVAGIMLLERDERP